MEKRCFKCESVLPVGDFYAHPKMKDGRLGKCKKCARRDVSLNRSRNLEHYRAYDKSRATPERLSRWKGRSKAWGSKHPDRRAAHGKVKRAVRSGELVRQPCEFCQEKKVDAHHDDYTKPLEVRWLCRPCHFSWHAHLDGKTPWRLIDLGFSF